MVRACLVSRVLIASAPAHAQVSHVFRQICPSEYDAAVLHTPAECPLFAMGDLRSGRQLLEDFPADSRLTMRRLSAARRGSPVVRRLCGAVAELVCGMEERVAEARGSLQLHQPAAQAGHFHGKHGREGPIRGALVAKEEGT